MKRRSPSIRRARLARRLAGALAVGILAGMLTPSAGSSQAAGPPRLQQLAPGLSGLFSPTYLYVWAGADDRTQPDRLVTLDYNPLRLTYGSVVSQTVLPGQGGAGNEPHHCGVSHDGMTLVCGGLLSRLKDQDEIFYFSLADPAHPTLTKTTRGILGSFPDDFIPQADGGFLLTELGAADGGSPGRVAKLDGSGDVVAEYPASPPPNFNPHGIQIREDLNLMTTCDYAQPASLLNGAPGGPIVHSSVQVWDLARMDIVSTIQLPDGAQSMDCKSLHHDSEGKGFVGGTGNGVLYLYNPSTGSAQPAFDLRSYVRGAQTQYMAISADDARLYVPYQSDVRGVWDGIAVLDITKPSRPRLIQLVPLGLDAGPHMSMLMNDGKTLVVSDYFLDMDDFGVIHENGDHYVRSLIISGAGLLAPDLRFQVNMDRAIPGVKLRPHGIAMAEGMAM